MASDQLVTSKAILKSLTEVRRLGQQLVLEHLEQVEPDLAGWLMEELSIVNRGLQNSNASSQQIRRLQKQFESLVLVAVVSVRRAQYDFWNETNEVPPGALDRPAADNHPTTPLPPIKQ